MSPQLFSVYTDSIMREVAWKKNRKTVNTINYRLGELKLLN